MLQDRFDASERRACQLLRQPRTTQRYIVKVRDDESPLTARVIELASMFGAYGYRTITGLLRGDGWHVNHKRVERIWRREGLKVPKKQTKRGRLWLNDGACIRLRAQRPNHVWSYDFVHGRTHDSRSFRMPAIIDESTRECLAIDVAGKLNHDDVLERLAWLMVTRGVPGHIRSDNSSEFTAKQVRDWPGRVGAKTLYITPGSPWENGYIESFNGKLSNELLEREIFYSLHEAKVLIERWRVHYNTVRPHSSLGYRPPAPEAIAPCLPASATAGKQGYTTELTDGTNSGGTSIPTPAKIVAIRPPTFPGEVHLTESMDDTPRRGLPGASCGRHGVSICDSSITASSHGAARRYRVRPSRHPWIDGDSIRSDARHQEPVCVQTPG